MCKKRLLMLACVLFSVLLVHAQTKKITGKVISSQKAPLAGVTVQAKGSKSFTSTSEDGSFTITVPNKPKTVLIFTSVSYETKEMEISSSEAVEVVLNEDVKGLNDVVVVGYGTSRKKDLTGSVASVPIVNDEKIPVFGTSQLLEGQVAGVQVTQTNSQPGASFTVRIRGTNSISSSSDPLFVIDGYPGGDISTINAEDIASIEVLKDASSTAIYGSRGANGVILVTTKRGVAGKNTISFNAYTGTQQVANELKMMNAKQFATYLDQVATIQGTALPYSQSAIDAMGEGTNWQDSLFRHAPISNYSLSFSGGNGDTRYFLSFSYFNQQGVIMGSGYKRGAVRFNLDRKVSNKIKVGFNSQLSQDFQDLSNVNTNGGSTGGTLLDALLISPIIPVHDSTGNFTFQNYPLPYVNIIGNPIAAATLNTDKAKSLRLLLNAFSEYEIIKNLRFKTTFGGQLRNRGENVFRPNTTYLGLSSNGFAQIATSNFYDWVNENTLTYDKQFGSIHAINVLAGFTYQETKSPSSTATATNLSSNSYGTDNLGVGAAPTVSSGNSKNVLVSGLGRINYRLMEKYLFTFSFRADGSSVFGENKKWGYFPSGAIAWRISDENFIKNNVPAISDLKLRTSYGLTGNQNIGSYNSLTQYGTNSYQLGGTRVVGISPNNIANADLSWESTAALDIGLDLALWNKRIIFNVDYYNKKTTKLLYSVPLPSTSGFTNMLQNVGSVRNKGFEFSLGTVNIARKNLTWTTFFNFSRNINTILSLGNVSYQYTGNVSSSLYPSGGQFSSILQVGQPIGSFYGYVFNGIWQSQSDIQKSGTKQSIKPGDPIYKDLTGDSAITAADRTIIGHALPKFTYGFNSNLTVGRFNLYVLVQGVYGNNILNENRIEMENGVTNDNKFAYVATKSWTGPGTSNTLGSVGSTERRGLGVTSDVIEDGSYMRIKTVTLSYELPLPKLTSVFRSASIYITGQNLITFTHYSGYDPEVNSYPNSSGNYTSVGTDYNPYPNIRTYTAGIKLGF